MRDFTRQIFFFCFFFEALFNLFASRRIFYLPRVNSCITDTPADYKVGKGETTTMKKTLSRLKGTYQLA